MPSTRVCISAAPQQQVYSNPLEMTVQPRRKAPKFSETSSKPPPPVVQLDPATNPNWYLADPTLRRGDIVVTNRGVLVYQGGIDDKPTANPADIKEARNHVLAALDEMKAGKKVSVTQARPYGCSVKYAS